MNIKFVKPIKIVESVCTTTIYTNVCGANCKSTSNFNEKFIDSEPTIISLTWGYLEDPGKNPSD